MSNRKVASKLNFILAEKVNKSLKIEKLNNTLTIFGKIISRGLKMLLNEDCNQSGIWLCKTSYRANT